MRRSSVGWMLAVAVAFAFAIPTLSLISSAEAKSAKSSDESSAGGGENSLFDSTTVMLTDVDGDTATDSLVVQIVDDVPTANNDAYTIFEGDSDNAITFDVDNRRLDVDLSDDEIARRVEVYASPPAAYDHGVMAKYAKLVSRIR